MALVNPEIVLANRPTISRRNEVVGAYCGLQEVKPVDLSADANNLMASAATMRETPEDKGTFHLFLTAHPQIHYNPEGEDGGQ